MSNYFDSADDPLLMAILAEQRKRREMPRFPGGVDSPFRETPSLPPAGVVPQPPTSFPRPGDSPAAPAPPPSGPPEPPPPFDPYDEPPGDVPPTSVLPVLPTAPPVPQPPMGAPDRLTPSTPSPAKPLGGALALALMRSSRPSALGMARSRAGRSRNAGLRTRTVR